MHTNTAKVMGTVLLTLLAALFLLNCGDDGGSASTPDDNDQVESGSRLIGESGQSYSTPHVITREGSPMIVYRSQSGIYATDLSNNDTHALNLGDSAVPSYGITQYAVSDNYFVWNAGTPNAYRNRWEDNTTRSSLTGVLAPGYCITKDRSDRSIFVATNTGGSLRRIKLDTFENSEPTTLLDPDRPSLPISIQAFACNGNFGYVGTGDGRLYEINLLDNDPSLPKVAIVENEYFDLMQYQPPYLVWLDRDGNVKMYNTQERQSVELAVNIDPQGRASARIMDMRLHVDSQRAWILWSDDSEGSYDVYRADLLNMEDAYDYDLLTPDPNNQRFPFYYNGTLYWQDDRSDPESTEIWYGSL